MGINVLQRAGELVVEPINNRNDAAGDLEDLSSLGLGGLVLVVPLLRGLDNDKLGAGHEHINENVELLLGAGNTKVSPHVFSRGFHDETHAFHCSFDMYD